MNMDVLYNMFGGFDSIVFFNFDSKLYFLNFLWVIVEVKKCYGICLRGVE